MRAKRRRAWYRLPSVVLLGTLLLAACGTDGSHDGGAAAVTHRGNVVPVQMGALTAEDVAAAQAAFGLELLAQLCQRAPEQNVLVSPTSAAQALSLLYPAAGGSTAEALQSLLHLPAWSPEVVAALRAHTAALDALRHPGDLDDEDAPDSLQTSNRLWTAVGVDPDPRYLDDIATALAADVRELDFAGDPEGATRQINTTVGEDTRGLIERLFDSPLSPDTVAVLTNAMHLKARWAVPFYDTTDAAFRGPAGEVTAEMMIGGAGGLREVDGWQAVELPFRDGTLAAVAVLPPDGTHPCAMDAATLSALRLGDAEPVGVQLPRLTITQTHRLLDPLGALGLPSGGEYPALGGPLEITEAVQKVLLEVDEDGVEAAAATGLSVGVSGSAGPVTVVTFDRPFLLLLTDTATGSPLFLAAVHDPTA